jgi:hypothetical protein
MEDLKEKLEALEAKFKDYCKSHGYDVKRDSDNDVKGELHEIADLLRGMQPKEKSKLDERFERKKRRNEPRDWY